jgi:hypothetical protein
MKSGVMSSEPELNLSDISRTTSIPVHSSTQSADHPIRSPEVSKKDKRKKVTVAEARDATKTEFSIANDEFFDMDDD